VTANVVVAASGIVVCDGELLVVRRGAAPGAGKWSVPGGRVEFGETLHETVAREVLEETGIAVTVGGFAGWVERIGVEDTHFVILDFFARPRDHARRAPVAGDDAEEARWTPLSQVAQLDMVDGLLEFLHTVGILPR
jgi:ADP-ribose pyrophosphatase YjhB (NUDIX family)